MIWKQKFTLEGLNEVSKNTMVTHLGIEFIDFGADFLLARMPVDARTIQPMGLLHGGASATLAETIGSVAGLMCVDDINTKSVVGVELNCSHLKSARGGYVYGKVSPVKIGRKIQVWQIDIKDEKERSICVSRLTIMVLDR